MVYNLVLAGLSVAGLILLSIFPRALTFAWASPDFLLLLVVFNAMFRGSVHGGAAGFLIGLAEDLFFGRFIGLNALSKCAVGFLCGSLSKSIFKENMWVPVINVLIASLCNIAIVFIMGHLAGARWYFSSIAYQGMFELLFNICLVPFLYGLFFQFADKQLSQKEDKE